MNLFVASAVIILALLLFSVLLACVEAGYRLGRWRIARNPDVVAGAGVIEAAIFGLLGLLLAFQFSAAQSRLEARRGLIVQEANALGTAYMRIDLLPPDARPRVRDMFRRYADARIAAFDSLPDVARYEQKLAEAADLQEQIWSAALVAATGEANPATRTLVLPPINQAIDITTARTIATANHVRGPVAALLGMVSLVGALLAGHAMAVRNRGRSVLHEVAFAVVIAAMLLVMFDLEFPRFGLIRDGDADRAMHDARAAMR